MKPNILIAFYSRTGHTQKLAEAIADGVESLGIHSAVLRILPPVRPSWKEAGDSIPDSGPMYATLEDLKSADGLLLGSPTRFGNMAAPVQHFIESASQLWHNNTLINKPAGVFCSTGSLHGGQEATLLSMMTPLLHLGMIPVGIPYSEKDLMETSSGGTPYGASHLAGGKGDKTITQEEKRLAAALGQRVSRIAQSLHPLFHLEA